MSKPLFTAWIVTCLTAFAVPTVAAAAELSAAEVLQRAFAPKQDALAACGARIKGKDTRAVARLSFDLRGHAQRVRIEGLASEPSARECLVQHLSELRVPANMAFVIDEVSVALTVK
jgi:hypothetical protein